MWKTVQIFYYADARHDLIADGIGPVMQRLQQEGAVDQFWMNAHWKLGPHLDLHLQTDEERLANQVVPVLLPHLKQYLQEHPSTTLVDEATLAAMHEQVAALEYEDGPFSPFVPDNTVRVQPSSLRPRFWGGEEATALVSSFFSETTPLLLELAHEIRDDDTRRLEWAMGLMIATVAWGDELKGQHLCYRSHAQGFLHGQDPDGQVKVAMNDWYLENESWISSTLQRWCDMATGRIAADARLAGYMDLMADYHKRFRTGLADGHFALMSREDVRDLAEARAPGSTAAWPKTMSTYHTFMGSYPSSPSHKQSTWFHAFRYVVNLNYNLLATLGVVALEKYFLCYAIARYMETYFGQKWWEIVIEKQGLPPGATKVEMVDEY